MIASRRSPRQIKFDYPDHFQTNSQTDKGEEIMILPKQSLENLTLTINQKSTSGSSGYKPPPPARATRARQRNGRRQIAQHEDRSVARRPLVPAIWAMATDTFGPSPGHQAPLAAGISGPFSPRFPLFECAISVDRVDGGTLIAFKHTALGSFRRSKRRDEQRLGPGNARARPQACERKRYRFVSRRLYRKANHK